jgi:2-iminobutanoate/2-iminopropanoate deaminase
MRLNTFRVLASLLLCVVTAIPLAAAGETPRHIVGDQSPARSALPFSDAVFVGDTLYLAGRLGTDPKTGKVGEDPETEVRLIMDALRETLKSSGLTMDDLVSVTVYCTDLGLYDRFNTVYKGYFHGKYPSRAFIGVATLLRGAHFEVQGIAVRSSAQH